MTLDNEQVDFKMTYSEDDEQEDFVKDVETNRPLTADKKDYDIELQEYQQSFDLGAAPTMSKTNEE